MNFIPLLRKLKLWREKRTFPATRDFTIDYCIKRKEATLIPHTRVAQEWLSERLSSPVVADDQIVEIAHLLRMEGFRVNS